MLGYNLIGECSVPQQISRSFACLILQFSNLHSNLGLLACARSVILTPCRLAFASNGVPLRRSHENKRAKLRLVCR